MRCSASLLASSDQARSMRVWLIVVAARALGAAGAFGSVDAWTVSPKAEQPPVLQARMR